MGIIPQELISIWKQEKIEESELVKIGKNIMIAMRKIWNFRCKYNLIRSEKSIPVPIQKARNYSNKKEMNELSKLISKEITMQNYQNTKIYC